MGQNRQFRCTGCGYAAIVSGGSDCGFTVRTQTIACSSCKELVDVVTSEEASNPQARKLPLRCPRSRTVKHPVTKWKAGGPCPRCGAKMHDTGEVLIMWD